MRVILIDGKNLCFRTGWVHKTLQATDGTRTGCLHGFLTSLLRLKKAYPDSRFLVAWDSPHDKKSWRFRLFPAYKDRGSGPVPEFVMEIAEQVPLVQEAMAHLGIPQLRFDGVEADDIISVLARESLKEGWNPAVYSSDRDYVQLMPLGVGLIRDSVKGQPPVMMDRREAEDYFKVPLEKVLWARAVTGDKSDCIPGAIPGVGPVKAAMLISAGLDPTKKTLAEQPRSIQLFVGQNWQNIRRNYMLMKMLSKPNDETRLGDGAQAFAEMIAGAVEDLRLPPSGNYGALVEMLGRLEMVALLGSRRQLQTLQDIDI